MKRSTALAVVVALALGVASGPAWAKSKTDDQGNAVKHNTPSNSGSGPTVQNPPQATMSSICIKNGTTLEGLGSFTGTITYDGISELIISLKNTSLDGFLTGFVFNIDGNATAALSPNPQQEFENLVGNGLKASPFGKFEAGAAIGGDWSGGGKPQAGLAAGEDFDFHFTVSGAGASGLTADSFFSEFGVHPPGSSNATFAVRWRGFLNGGSDKSPGLESDCLDDDGGHDNNGGGPVVPLPSSVWSGMGMMGALLIGMNRKKIMAALT